MAWGNLSVGRIPLHETHVLSHQVNATTGEQSVSIEGQEAMPPLDQDGVRARQEDLMAMLDRALPLIFERKDNHTGFYRVKDVGTRATYWVGEAEFFGWNLSLTRIGTENAVDMESRLASIVRANDFALTGERWHAPSPGAYGYFTGTTQPGSSVSRSLADGEGAITVYRAIPAGVHPRWGITAPNYLRGRARVLVNWVERSGVGFRVPDALSWEINNGLVRVRPRSNGGVLSIGVWDTGLGGWSEKPYGVIVGTEITPPFDSVTVLRNDFEAVVIRLVKSKSPGRILVDLTLRRGSRVVEGYVQTDSSATMGFMHSPTPLNRNPFFEELGALSSTAVGYFLKVGSTFNRTTGLFHEGIASGLLTPDGVSASAEFESWPVPCSPGMDMQMSMWVRIPVSRNMNFAINWFSNPPPYGGGPGTGYLSSTASPATAIVANTWTQVFLTGVAPASTQSASIDAYLDATPAASTTLRVDEVKLGQYLLTTNNAATGYLVAAADDTDGNRAAMGSPRSFTGSTNGVMTKTAVTSFAFWAGTVVDGSAPAAGDAATDLRNQYIGSLAEQTLAVAR